MGLLSSAAKVGRGILDMSAPARKQRGNDMGFDTDTKWYHGSPVASSIDKFDLSMPKATDEGFLGNAVYMTPHSYIAKAYARNDYDSGVLDLHTSANKFKDFNYIDHKSYRKEIEDFSREIGVKSEYNTQAWANEFTEKMQARGYEGARGLNHDGSVAELAVYDTAKLRKTDAVFDPAKASSSNLLASNPAAGVGAGVLGAIGASQSDNTYADYSPANLARLRNNDVGSIQAPQSMAASNIAGLMSSVNKVGYDDSLLGMVAPQLPSELMNKIAYNDKRGLMDYAKAYAGLLGF